MFQFPNQYRSELPDLPNLVPEKEAVMLKAYRTLKAYLINLDRSKDRLEFFMGQAKT